MALRTYMLLNLGLNNDKRIHTLPLLSVPFYISPSQSLPLQTLSLVSLVSLITKTKRIGERSAIVTHTHYHTQTDKVPKVNIWLTSGFWTRVRARVLRAPVFSGSLPRPTGRCAPPAQRSFAAPP